MVLSLLLSRSSVGGAGKVNLSGTRTSTGNIYRLDRACAGTKLLPNGNIEEDLHRCCCLAQTFSALSAFWSRVKSGSEFSTFPISTLPWFSFVSFVFNVRRTDCQCKRSCTWRHRAMSTNPIRSLFWSSGLMR